MPFSFYKIGADVEWLAKTRGRHIHANKITGVTKNPSEFIAPNPNIFIPNAYIGIDGEPSVGELRPPPSKSIYPLLVYLGTAVTLLAQRLPPNTTLIAHPYDFGRAVGGHIHVSFISRNTHFLQLRKEGYVAYNPERHYRPDLEKVGFIYATKFSSTLSWAIMPFERAMQPVEKLRRRNNLYGHSDLSAREDHFPEQPLHLMAFEYRRPSTWLAHPDLAYCYLALAKLVSTNFPIMGPLVDTCQSTVEGYLSIMEKGVVSSDLKPLRNLIPKLIAQGPFPREVNLDAWKRWAVTES